MGTKLNIAREVATLKRMTVKELRGRYLEVFGEQTRSGNKDFLWKRIAWRIQANAEGDLPERARRRAEELANDADLRQRRPADKPQPSSSTATKTTHVDFGDRAGALMPGTVLTRVYKGQNIVVTVLDSGFEWEGEMYRSLSAVAKAVTGSHWSGNYFFGLKGRCTA
ncbi:MAG: DUF2924 domain-containing protein [Phycisphaerae bacterium]|nr:DUF2924 domain-containing protein [Phycisphaerae bacterium]